MPQLTRVLFGCLALMIGLVIAQGGCTPVIEGWRDVSGISKNDPGPDAPFTKNLAAAEAEAYPNLASVPPPPARATTAAERQKLTQSLVADRAAVAAAGGTTASPARAPAAPTLRPAYAASPPPAVALAASSARVPAPSPAASPAASPAVKTVKTATAGTPAGSPARGPAPPEAPSPNSTLQTPEIGPLPEPEAARPAPPPASLPAAPRPAVGAGPSPAALASVAPEAPPPVPDLAPPPPPPSAPGKPATKRAPGLVTVATLAGGAAGGREEAEIAKLAARYKQEPGRVRVVAYAAAPAAGSDPLASYQAALDRAQAIAKALAAAGIPAGKIQTEATPASAAAGAGRVEVQFGP
jgi:hypothetical protein